MKTKTKLLSPIQPGEILIEDFMKPHAISINKLARDLHVPPNRIHLCVAIRISGDNIARTVHELEAV